MTEPRLTVLFSVIFPDVGLDRFQAGPRESSDKINVGIDAQTSENVQNLEILPKNTDDHIKVMTKNSIINTQTDTIGIYYKFSVKNAFIGIAFLS